MKMDFMEKIGLVAHEVNRAYCEALGDFSQPTWEDAPEWQKNSTLSGVRFHLTHHDAGPEAAHENWMAEKLQAGWVYGNIKSPEKKTHPLLVDFCDLPKEHQIKDFLFKAVVHAVNEAFKTGKGSV